MRARPSVLVSRRPSSGRHQPQSGVINGPGAPMLSVAIFGRAEPLRGAAARETLRRMRARLREVALALLLGTGGLLLVVALRLALAAHRSATLGDALRAWLPHLT